LKPKQFCELLKGYGFNLFVGVPCSILKPILKLLENDPEIRYVVATREDEAIGIAVGAQLGGMKPVVFMQNSGFGLSINALCSLALPYRFPLLFLITWRGYQGLDAPEHVIMGKILTELLNDVEVKYWILEKENTRKTVSVAVRKMYEENLPVALLLKRGIIE